jgi:hypothetical protein
MTIFLLHIFSMHRLTKRKIAQKFDRDNLSVFRAQQMRRYKKAETA